MIVPLPRVMVNMKRPASISSTMSKRSKSCLALEDGEVSEATAPSPPAASESAAAVPPASELATTAPPTPQSEPKPMDPPSPRPKAKAKAKAGAKAKAKSKAKPPAKPAQVIKAAAEKAAKKAAKPPKTTPDEAAGPPTSAEARTSVDKQAANDAALSKVAADTSDALSRSESLDAKLEVLRESGLDPESKVQLLRDSLTPSDWNKANSRFSTAAKRTTELATAAESANKNQGRLGHRQIVAGWLLDPTVSSVFTSLTHRVTGGQRITKKDNWVSWKKISETWTEEEIEMHLATGRIVTRECPDTAGVWEYKDTNEVTMEKTLDRAKVFDQSSKRDLNPEEKEKNEQEWSQIWGAFGSSASFSDVSVFNSAMGMQVQPKGKGFAKGKGKGSKGAWVEEVEEDENATVDKKKVLQLKNLLARTSNRLGCLGFEAPEDKERQGFAKDKKEIDALDIDACYTMTNGTFAAFAKQAHDLVNSCKKKYDGKF